MRTQILFTLLSLLPGSLALATDPIVYFCESYEEDIELCEEDDLQGPDGPIDDDMSDDQDEDGNGTGVPDDYNGL